MVKINILKQWSITFETLQTLLKLWATGMDLQCWEFPTHNFQGEFERVPERRVATPISSFTCWTAGHPAYTTSVMLISWTKCLKSQLTMLSTQSETCFSWMCCIQKQLFLQLWHLMDSVWQNTDPPIVLMPCLFVQSWCRMDFTESRRWNGHFEWHTHLFLLVSLQLLH